MNTFREEYDEDPEDTLEYQEYLEQRLEQEIARTNNFENCLRRANALWVKDHPDSNYWPDGAVNYAWIVEQIKKLEDQKKLVHEYVESTLRGFNMNKAEAEAVVEKLTGEDDDDTLRNRS